MPSVLDLGIRTARSVEPDLHHLVELLDRAEKTTNVGYGEGPMGPNVCAMGAVARVASLSHTVFPTGGAREEDLVRELFFSIPREERDALVANKTYSEPAKYGRQSVIIAYNDTLTKDEVVAWAQHALHRVQESERHRA